MVLMPMLVMMFMLVFVLVMIVVPMLVAMALPLLVMVMMVFVYHGCIRFLTAKLRRPACNRVANAHVRPIVCPGLLSPGSRYEQ